MKDFLTTSIKGVGLVGPCGCSVSDSWEAVRQRQSLAYEILMTIPPEKALYALSVPPAAVAAVARLPRLRRSSPISHYAVTAARAALAEAGLSAVDFSERASLLFFAASNGSVLYTRRFFGGVVEGGPGAGSPLLFPETVYNAPASHVAADLGFQGNSLSLVGDAAIGLEACHLAACALHSGQAELALVVAAEEVDAFACAGYAAWRLAGTKRGTECCAGSVFSGGAGALLLSLPDKPSRARLRTTPGHSFSRIYDGLARLREDLARWREQKVSIAALFSSDSGNWIGRRETRVLQEEFPGVPLHAVKKTLGEGLSAATLWQIILALSAQSMGAEGSALISCLGFNGQVATALLEKN